MHQITIFYCNGDNDLRPSLPSPAYYCYRGLTRTNHRCPSFLIHPSTLPDDEILNSYVDKCDHKVCQDNHPSRQWPNNEYQLLPELMMIIVHLIYVDKPLYPYLKSFSPVSSSTAATTSTVASTDTKIMSSETKNTCEDWHHHFLTKISSSGVLFYGYQDTIKSPSSPIIVRSESVSFYLYHFF